MGKTVVATNGCFDILHVGHVRYLQKTKRFADYSVVLLNSDKSVKSIKGPTRPINNEQDRADPPRKRLSRRRENRYLTVGGIEKPWQTNPK